MSVVHLSDDELAILIAVVKAEEAGEDPHTAALDAVPALEADRARFMVTLQRLKDGGYLDVAISRGGDRLQAAVVRRALPKGVDATRAARSPGEFLLDVELQLVERIVRDLLQVAEDDASGLDREARADLAAQADTVAAQARSPRPRRRIIVETLKTARNILEGAAGSALCVGVMRLIDQLT